MRDVAGISIDTDGLVSFSLINRSILDVSEDIQRFCALLMTDAFITAVARSDSAAVRSAIATALFKMNNVIHTISVDTSDMVFKFVYTANGSTFTIAPE